MTEVTRLRYTTRVLCEVANTGPYRGSASDVCVSSAFLAAGSRHQTVYARMWVGMKRGPVWWETYTWQVQTLGTVLHGGP